MESVARTQDGPEIEVTAKAARRRFTVEYKRRVVREADACKTAGAVGALLRREGLPARPARAGLRGRAEHRH